MRIKTPTHIFRLLIASVALIALIVAPSVFAADGTWTAVGNNLNWSTAGNWSGGTIANGAGFSASFTSNITGNRNVILDTSRTIGVLNFGDPDGSSAFTLGNNSTGSVLTMDGNGANAQINTTTAGRQATITVPLLLNSSLDINNNATAGTALLTLGNATAGITAGTAGVKTITNLSGGAGGVTLAGVIGDGSGTVAVVQNSSSSTLTLGGANTFTGGLIVKNGTVSATAASGLGAGTVTLGDTSGSANASLQGNGNTFSNAITVAAGSSGNTLTIGNSGNTSAVFSGGVTLNNNLTVNAGGTGSVNLSGAAGNITGTGALTVTAAAGTNTITLAGTNTYSGGTTLNSGTLDVANASGLGTGTLVIAGGTLNTSAGSFTIANNIMINGDFSMAGNTGATTSNFSGDVSLGTAAGTSRTITETAANAGTGNPIFSGVISDGTTANKLIKAGTGAITLQGANTFTGGVDLNAGTLFVNNNSALGSGTLTLANGVTLSTPGTTARTIGNAVVLGGNFTLGVAGKAPLTLGGTMDLGGAARKITAAGGASNINIISGAISNDGGGGLSIDASTSADGLTLSGSNTFTGNLTILATASVFVPSEASLGLGSKVTVNQNGLLQATANMTTTKDIELIGASSKISASSGKTLTVNGAVFGTSLTPGINSGTVVLNGSNSFATGSVLLINGGASVSLGNASSLNGTTLKYNAGTGLDNVGTGGSAFTTPIGMEGLQFTSGMTFVGTNSLDLSGVETGFVQTAGSNRTITVSANTLTMNGIGTTGNFVFSGTGKVDGGLIKAGAGTLVLAGASDYTLGTTINAGTLQIGNGGSTGSLSTSSAITNNGVLAFNRSNTVTQGTNFATGISGTGSVVQNGTGNLVLAPGNTYSGNTTVNGGGTGSITITADSALGTAPGVATAGHLVLNDGGLVTVGTMVLNSNRGILLGGTAGGQINVASGTTTYGGIIAGSKALQKAGSGVLLLGGVNTYTGATVISAGTLALGSGGSIDASSGINLGTSSSQGVLDLTAKSSYAFGASQTVSGYGTLNIGAGKMITINGNLAPGNSPGIVSVTGDLTLAGTVTMELAGTGGVAGTDFDQTSVSGALVWGGSISIVSFGGFNINQVGSYNLFDFASQSGSLTGVDVGGIALTYNGLLNSWQGSNGGGFNYSFNLNDGVLDVVPEPATWLLAALGLTVTVVFRRRRRD